MSDQSIIFTFVGKNDKQMYPISFHYKLFIPIATAYANLEKNISSHGPTILLQPLGLNERDEM